MQFARLLRWLVCCLALALPTFARGEEPYDLATVIALALQRNPDLRAATHRIDEAQARLEEAFAAFYPHLGLRLQYSRTDNPAQAFAMIVAQRRFAFGQNINRPGPTDDVRPEINATLPLFRGGQDYFRARAARHLLYASQGEAAATRNALVDMAAAAYLALLSAPEHVETANASATAIESTLRLTRSRSAEGVALRSDVLSLEARLAAAQEAKLRALNATELARASLRTILAFPAGAPLEVIPPAPATQSLDVTFDEALARAATMRPELRAAREMVAAREAELRAEQAALLPRVDLVGSYGQNATNLDLSRSRYNWFFGATAEWDLFNGFRTTARVRAAQEKLAEARENLEKARLAIELELHRSYLDWRETQEREQVSRVALDAAEEALRLVNEQYREGVVTVTRYLEAEAARTEARARFVTARFDARRAEVALRKAMGEWAEEGKHP